MTRKQKKRRTEIIRQLSDLSKDSWRNARYEDYAPLEAELRKLQQDAQEAALWADHYAAAKKGGKYV